MKNKNKLKQLIKESLSDNEIDKISIELVNIIKEYLYGIVTSELDYFVIIERAQLYLQDSIVNQN